MNAVAIEPLRLAVEQMHRCKAAYRASERVGEAFPGGPSPEANVHTFALSGHATTNTCFAWSGPVGDTHNLRVYALLKLGRVQSARDAIRVSTALSYRDDPGSQLPRRPFAVAIPINRSSTERGSPRVRRIAPDTKSWAGRETAPRLLPDGGRHLKHASRQTVAALENHNGHHVPTGDGHDVQGDDARSSHGTQTSAARAGELVANLANICRFASTTCAWGQEPTVKMPLAFSVRISYLSWYVLRSPPVANLPKHYSTAT